MAVKKIKPRTPGSRGTILLDRSELSKKHSGKGIVKSLVSKLKKHTGRNNQGRITCRHKGGGNKKKYRLIDFKRDKIGVPAIVRELEYDPNRNVHIALLFYADGDKRYILAPKGLVIGASLSSGPEAEFKPGNAMALRDIPLGEVVHNIELQAGRGAQLVRSAGGSAQLLAKESNYATLRMPSGEMRKVLLDCFATIGELGNSDIKNVVLGKAGRSRHRGIKPTVRGSAMNPVDHAHGGGEGKAPIGGIPKSHTGKRLGLKTRKRKNASNRLIITSRKGRKVAGI